MFVEKRSLEGNGTQFHDVAVLDLDFIPRTTKLLI